jgi:hypothetical protein
MAAANAKDAAKSLIRQSDHSRYATKPFDDGSVYAGELKDGLRHGHGVMMWADGDVYNGQWQNDERHGHGHYTYAHGDQYVSPASPAVFL